MYIKSYEAGGEQVFTREYSLWNALNQRIRAKAPRNRTYKDCCMSENFKDFQFFANWCNEQIGFREVEESSNTFWNIDKDIVSKYNKVYSEKYCVFVPSALNKFLTTSKSARGLYPIGVDFSKNNNKFRARCNDGFKKSLHLGYFSNATDAFLAYKYKKELIAKQLAEFYFGKVDERVVYALNNYVVNLGD